MLSNVCPGYRSGSPVNEEKTFDISVIFRCWRCSCGVQCAMLGSVRTVLTDLLITAIILATTGVRSQHTWHPMRAPPWAGLSSSIAQVRSERDSQPSLLCQCLHTDILSQSDDCCHQADHICSDFPSNRLTRLLWNTEPQFSSPCWAREENCLPPVLSQTQINLIESDDKAQCRCVVEKVLRDLQETNEEMRKSLDVLLSVHMMVDCDDVSHCQTCKVSNVCDEDVQYRSQPGNQSRYWHSNRHLPPLTSL